MGPSTTNRQAAEKEKVENKRRCMRRQSARFQTYLYSCEIFQFRRGIQVFDVIGSGVVGLRYAREVAKIGSVAVITKAEPHEINKNYAQGNIKAVDLVKPQSLDQQVTSATESLKVSGSRRISSLGNRSEILYQILDASLGASASKDCSLRMAVILCQALFHVLIQQ